MLNEEDGWVLKWMIVLHTNGEWREEEAELKRSAQSHHSC